MAATLVHTSYTGAFNSSPDFDLYLYDPAGTLLAQAYTSSRQETVAARPSVTGRYTVRVKSYSGSGGYQLDLSAGGKARIMITANVASLSPAGDRTRLNADDNVYYFYSPGTAIVSWEATFANVPADATGLTVSTRARPLARAPRRSPSPRAPRGSSSTPATSAPPRSPSRRPPQEAPGTWRPTIR